jgi:hypothetical protein
MAAAQSSERPFARRSRGQDAPTIRRKRIEPREPDRPVQAGTAVKRDERPARSALVDMELDVADRNPHLEIL